MKPGHQTGRSVIFRKKDGQSGRAANATLRIPRLTTRAWLRSKLLNETVLDDPCPAVKAPVERTTTEAKLGLLEAQPPEKKVASLIVHKF
jgi:hypothetical protein